MANFIYLFLFAICFYCGITSGTERPSDINLTNINQLTPDQKKVVDWIKTYTVPNTRNPSGKPWVIGDLPSGSDVSGLTYKASIKPSAYAVAIVTAYSLCTEGIFTVSDFYRSSSGRCSCFKMPAQIPPQSGFPLQVFSYNLCQGTAVTPNPTTGKDDYNCDCNCKNIKDCPGRFIGPNQKCLGYSAAESDWQNGIFGMEQTHVWSSLHLSAAALASRAEAIYHGIGRAADYTYVDILDNTITTAGFPVGSSVYSTVMSCFPYNASKRKNWRAAGDLNMTCADLVSIWLTRNHLVGVTVALTDNLRYFIKDQPHHIASIQVLADYFNK